MPLFFKQVGHHKPKGGIHMTPSNQNVQKNNLVKKELSIEQRKHMEQNEHRKFEEMSNKKLDGPNRPAE
jgi:hypothetical protein